MRHLTNKLTKIVIPCVILYGLIACGINDESSLARTLSPPQLSSAQTEKTPTVLSTLVGLGATDTLITPTVPTTDPATATMSPQPTLQEQEKLNIVTELMQSNGGCELPCWWGLTPGVTNWLEAQQFFIPFAIDLQQGNTKQITSNNDTHWVTSYAVRYSIVDEPRGGGANFVVWDDIITRIFAGKNSTKERFSIEYLFSEIGKPDRVLVDTFPDITPFGLPFKILLSYPEDRIVAEFEVEGIVDGEHVVGCFGEVGPYLWLWSKSGEISGERMISEAIGDDSMQMRDLQNVTELNIDSFYQLVLHSFDDVCITTPSAYW